MARLPNKDSVTPIYSVVSQLVISPLWAQELSFSIMDSKDTINP